MEAAQSQFDAAVKERADKEAAKAAEVKRLAEEELDGFYDERTDEVRWCDVMWCGVLLLHGTPAGFGLRLLVRVCGGGGRSGC